MSLKDLLPEGTFEEIKAQADAVSSSDEKANKEESKDSSDHAIYVTCPTCHKRVKYSSDNPFRPFCSERCKLIDLGAWASDERKVAGDSLFDDGKMHSFEE